MGRQTNRAAWGFGLACLGALVGGVGSAALAGPGQQVDLRYNLPAGSSIQVQEAQSLAIVGQASDNFGNQQQVNQSFSGALQYQMEVLGDNAGVPNRVKLTFAPNLSLKMNDGQNEQSEGFAFSGKTYEVDRQNGGFRLEPQDGLDADSQEFIKEITELGWRSLLPGRAVSVGETWQPDSSAYLRAAALDPGSTIQINAKLVDVAPQNGRPTAELDLEFNINGATEGLPLKGTQRGKAFIDVATGVAVAINLNGELPLQVQGDQGSLNGKCTWAIQRQASIMNAPAGGGGMGPGGFLGGGGGSGGTSGGGGSGGGGSGGGNWVEEDENGNVIANGQSAPPFAGTYSNDKLKVTLIEAPDDGRRTIQIVRGDITSRGYLTGNRNVTMNAQPDGSMDIEVTFQGKFQYGDKEFDFNAKQPDHNRLLFTTGSTTHDLTLERAEEPNPFE